ncbi:MAG: carbohydrate ABC transporter permease [Propionibacteriaceae bacterium]|nr:carbohydrate ABC transporter permease [Propionibacteriaceae bacterium]
MRQGLRFAGEGSNRSRWIFFGVLVIMATIYLFPFAVQLANSFKTDQEATRAGLSLLSDNWVLTAYSTLFSKSAFPRWFANSVIVTLCVTAGRVLFNSMAGYALARMNFLGRNVLFTLVVGVMAVPGVVLLIPKFLIIRQLGIYNSYLGLIIPLLVDAAGVFIMKNFFESIPVAIEEAARIDGAGTFRIFWSVVLPMARPALITIIILSFQGSWNELSHFIVASSSPDLVNLTKGVAQLAGGGLGAGNQYPLKLAAATLMTIPVAALFLIFQKRIMNTTGGAVKE